jgi:hypothetical protein
VRRLLLCAALLLSLWPSGMALACSCVASSPEQQRADAPLVFIGLATERREVEGGIRVRFAVREVFKGTTPQQAIIEVPADEAGCGIAMQVDVEYLIFASPSEQGTPRTHLCMGTTDEVAIAADWEPRFAYPESTSSPPPSPLATGDGLPASRVALAAGLAAFSLFSLILAFGRLAKARR